MDATLCVLVLAVAQPAVPQAPEVAYREALADCEKLAPVDRVRARYLSRYDLSDPKILDQRDKVLAFHANQLSRELELIRPVRVSPNLWRVYYDDYGWQRDTWEKMANADPFFHVKAFLVDDWREEEKVVYHGGGDYTYPDDSGRINRNVAAGQYKVTLRFKVKKVKEQQAGAPWIDPLTQAKLIELTQSSVPVVRADWWLHQTAVQKNRVAGYYDWLGLKERKDFLKLIASDQKLAEERRKKFAGLIGRSGVTTENRRILGIPTLDGQHWFTEDFLASKDAKNVLRLIDGEAKKDAAEEYGTLPNGLWTFWLENGAGVRQDAAPSDIAGDKHSSSTDLQVHICLSCVRCHKEGLRPINDWARRTYKAPFNLRGADPEDDRRLRSLYLSDLERQIRKGNEAYAETLVRLNGKDWTPAKNAEEFAAAWDEYDVEDRDLARTARDVGLPEKEWTEKLRTAARRLGTSFDPLLAHHLQGFPLRAAHWEELFPTAMAIARDGK